jgi:hypothetical protein
VDVPVQVVQNLLNAGWSLGACNTAPLTVTATSGVILCHGGTTSVVVSASGGTAPYTGTGTFTVYAGTYVYTVTDNAGQTASTAITVTQPALLTASIADLPVSSVNSCAFGTGANIVIGYGGGATSVTLNGSADGGTGTKTFSWSPATGLNSATIANPVFTPSLTSGCANYVFTLTVTDANGCVATAQTSVKVTNVSAAGGKKVQVCHQTGSPTNPTVGIEIAPSAVAVHLSHGDCLGSCNAVCSTNARFMNAAEETVVVSESRINIYPNPTDGKFTVALPADIAEGTIQLAVCDITGRQIYTQVIANASNTMSVDIKDALANTGTGLYLVKISSENQYIEKISFIK